jgi:ATP phosphoribosyltransferase
MTVTLALPKGRIFEETMPFLQAAGIQVLEDPDTSRKLILQTTRPDVQLVIIRATDVPTFVEYGAADMGIACKDVLLEHGADSLYEPLDLNIACCKLMTAAHKDAPPITGRVRVATKYVNIAQRYFASLGIQADIIKLYGSMELAPLVGLADCIVDLVDTGNTLRANDLEPRDLIMNISSRLVVNKAAMKMKNAAIVELLKQFEQTLAKR